MRRWNQNKDYEADTRRSPERGRTGDQRRGDDHWGLSSDTAGELDQWIEGQLQHLEQRFQAFATVQSSRNFFGR